MTENTTLVDTLAGLTLDTDNLTLLCDMMRLAGALEPQRSTAFLKECLAELSEDDAGNTPADLLTPIMERWAVQS